MKRIILSMYVNSRSHLTMNRRVLEITIEYYLYYFTYWTDDEC